MRDYAWRRGDYNMTGERARVRQLPRVLKRQDRRRTTGEHFWTEMLTPRHADDNPVMSMVAWLEHFEPGASSIKHAHQNEAIFYILEGSGYEIHEGQRYDWKAGDVVIVPGGSVHQHFDPSTEERASALVINPKPLFFFLNLIHQQHLEDGSDPPPYEKYQAGEAAVSARATAGEEGRHG